MTYPVFNGWISSRHPYWWKVWSKGHLPHNYEILSKRITVINGTKEFSALPRTDGRTSQLVWLIAKLVARDLFANGRQFLLYIVPFCSPVVHSFRLVLLPTWLVAISGENTVWDAKSSPLKLAHFLRISIFCFQDSLNQSCTLFCLYLLNK